MIRFDLTCDQKHSFDSWFKAGAEFDRLSQAGLVTCPHCGSPKVTKALMAPALAAKSNAAPLSTPRDEAEAALARMRHEIETKSDYVGLSFATEARKMHAGEIAARTIHGEAKPEEARALLQDGVPVMPLPFVPKRQTN